MNAILQVGRSATYELENALLIYKRRSHYSLGQFQAGNESDTAVSVHAVNRRGDQPFLGPGTPLTYAAVESLAAALGRNLAACYLPENVVSLGFGQVAWWAPGAKRRIWFKPDGRFDGGSIKDDSETARTLKLNGKFVHHPPLLFIAGARRLSIFALIKNERPQPDTALYRAPYWNLWENGAMCAGNRAMSDFPVPSNIPDYEDAFFNSAFSHTNITRLCSHPRGHAGLWEEMAKNKRAPDDRYWKQNLVKIEMNVTEAIKKK